MTAHIREFVADDVAGVARLVLGTLAEFGFTSNVGSVEGDLASVPARYPAPRAGFWVAEDEGAIVGTVAVRPKDATTCELKRLYVRADCRGTGLGERLYRHAEAFALAAGYTRIWLDSSRRFTKARALYLRHGFVLVESLDNDWEDDVFEKRLRG
ncbi:MAG TPA: GNAT family N-acetyltransferase [Polyangiaceae bacterium]|jgi:GNAT superfamily N-acetyltransferase